MVVNHLLDADESHFAVWFRIRRIHLENKPEGPQPPDVTPLYYVTECGYRGLVDYLISKRPEDLNVRSKYGTPLHAALNTEYADIAQSLLGHCINVDVRDLSGHTPLHLAADHGFLDVVRTLVERNADTNARVILGDTTLHRMMSEWLLKSETTQDCRIDVMKFSLGHGADPDAKNDDHMTPLQCMRLHTTDPSREHS